MILCPKRSQGNSGVLGFSCWETGLFGGFNLEPTQSSLSGRPTFTTAEQRRPWAPSLGLHAGKTGLLGVVCDAGQVTC